MRIAEKKDAQTEIHEGLCLDSKVPKAMLKRTWKERLKHNIFHKSTDGWIYGYFKKRNPSTFMWWWNTDRRLYKFPNASDSDNE